MPSLTLFRRFRAATSLVVLPCGMLALSGCGGGGVATSPPASPYAPAPGVAAVPTPSAPPSFDPVPENRRIVEHRIESGDSLWKLARAYGTSVKEIRDANQMVGDMIQAGQTIRIPTPLPEGASPGTGTAAAAAPTVSDAAGLPPAPAPAAEVTADLFR